jgi:hypothetical protein
MDNAFVTRALENGDTRGTEAGVERATNLLEWFGVLPLVSSSAFAASGEVSISGATAWGASGSLTASSFVERAGGLAVSASGLMVADGLGLKLGGAVFGALGSVSFAALAQREGGADWAAGGVFAPFGEQSISGSLDWAADSTLTAFGEGGLYGFISYRLGADWLTTTPFVNISPKERRTEQGDTRITEAGLVRTSEKPGSGGWTEPDRAWVFVSGSWRRFI